jgi:uncharacterized protein YgiB involved in biofilm formation
MSTRQKHKRHSSQTLPLVLATSAAVAGLSGCGGETNNLTSVRDEYKSLEDCKEDWGSTDPCQPQPAPPNSNAIANTGNTSGGYIYNGRYWGPSYFEGQRDIAQRNVNASLTDRAIGRSITRSVSRGGFGSSSRGFSGGG